MVINNSSPIKPIDGGSGLVLLILKNIFMELIKYV
jgi:hypothetical protein